MNGLRRVGNFDEALAQANKDDAFRTGTISVTLQNHARNIINSPEFQRVRDRLEDSLQHQEVRHIQEKEFQHNVTNIAVDARINRNDLDYIVNNLAPKAPPPYVPPPRRDDAADRERLLAELDGKALEREKKLRAELVAERKAMELAASRTQTVPQQIVNNYHQHVTPVHVPAPIINNNVSIEAARHTGHSVHHLFLKTQAPTIAAEMPSGRPPPPPPAAGASRILAPGGATGPYPALPSTPAQLPPADPPPPPGTGKKARVINLKLKQKKDKKEEEKPPAPSLPPPPPSQGAIKKPKPKVIHLMLKRKKKGLAPVDDTPASRDDPYAEERVRAVENVVAAKKGKKAAKGSGFVPSSDNPAPFRGAGHTLGAHFKGTGQRLPEDTPSHKPYADLREKSLRRMREIGIAGEKKKVTVRPKAPQSLLGKRSRPFDSQPRTLLRGPAGLVSHKKRRVGDRPSGPQEFNIGT